MNWPRVLERLRCMAIAMFPVGSPVWTARYLELEDLVQQAALEVLRDARRRGAEDVADWHLRCRLIDAARTLGGLGASRATRRLLGEVAIDHQIGAIARRHGRSWRDTRDLNNPIGPLDLVADDRDTPEQAYLRAEPTPPFVWLGKQHFMRWA